MYPFSPYGEGFAVDIVSARCVGLYFSDGYIYPFFLFTEALKFLRRDSHS